MEAAAKKINAKYFELNNLIFNGIEWLTIRAFQTIFKVFLALNCLKTNLFKINIIKIDSKNIQY